MKLRGYQEAFVFSIAKACAANKRVVAQLATGGGKTVSFAAICDRYTKKSGKQVLIGVNRVELLNQTRRTCYNAFGITCQPIKAGMKYIPQAEVYVGMVESVYRRLEMFSKAGIDIGMLIIDECHRLEFIKLVAKIEEHFPDVIIIGFSATPLSSSKKRPLKNYYDAIVCGESIRELIKMGNLCQNITYAPKDTVDRLELAMKGDDFDEVQMAQTFSRAKYIQNTIKAYRELAEGEKALIFNVNIFHSEEVAKAFVEAGYPCRHLDSYGNNREETLKWFAVTPGAILCNVGIATTGFDEPTIQVVIVNKATASMPLWVQMGGRGSRPSEGKSIFKIIDMGGNAITHGDWCDDRNWEDIFYNPPKPGKAQAAPVKACPNCDAIVPASKRVCPFCQLPFPLRDVPLEVELSEFVTVTKGIDVPKLIEQNRDRKEHYTFFQIGRMIAYEAKKHIKEMSNEYFNFISLVYDARGKEWANKNGKKYNKWYKIKSREFLIEQLKSKYPNWDAPKYDNYEHQLL